MKSYPYLTIAREHGVDYGVVLAFADAVRKKLRQRSGAEMGLDLDVWETRACGVVFGMGDPKLRERVRSAVLTTLREKGEHV